jgi:hypothetical protein
MKTKLNWLLAAIAVGALFFTSCKKLYPPVCDSGDSTVATVKVYATGLNSPRGLKFGLDGNLYVAEAGVGGTNMTHCVQVVPPVGPYTGSDSGARISQISPHCVRTTYVDHLPSSMASPLVGGSIEGVADIAFIGNTMYAILAGAGCSHGVPDIPNGIIRINPDKSWTMVANISHFLKNNPVQHPEEDDFEPDGTPYSMINVGLNTLYFVEPNHGELDKFSPGGSISRVVDVSATYGHIVPTTVVHHKGDFYIGNLDTFPIMGGSKVYKVTPDGQISEFASGFSTILGVAFDNHDRLYVLECTVGAAALTPGLGQVERIDPNGNREVIVSGLNLPTAMTFGPDGKLYISNWGIGAPGMGEILQVGFKCEEVMGDMNP